MKECPIDRACFEDVDRICPVHHQELGAGLPGPPRVDGRYLLLRRVGQGAMGVVFRARHEVLQRDFALKLLRPDGGTSFAVRFRREAEALGRLAHPNIVGVTDYGVAADGVAFLAMELLEGESVLERLERAPLDVASALRIITGVARAMDFAHAQGVLHRDLKPANLFLGADGRVLVLDFGVARLLDSVSAAPPREPAMGASAPAARSATETEPVQSIPEDSASVTTTSATVAQVPASGNAADDLTGHGRVVGTALYLAPELLRGQPASVASDVYALAVTAYQLLSGAPPFTGSIDEVFNAHLKRAPAKVTDRNPNLPEALNTPLLRGLEKEPQLRPASAGALAADLEAAYAGVQLRAWRRREVPRRSRWALLLGGSTAVLAALLVTWHPAAALEDRVADRLLRLRAPRPPDPRLTLVVLDDASLDADPRPLAQRADEVAAGLDALFAAGAAAVAVDLLLPETWGGASPFSRAVLENADHLTLAAFAAADGRVVGPQAVQGLVASALGPDAADLFGFVNVIADDDGQLRRLRFQGSWAAAAARHLDPTVMAPDSDPFRLDPGTQVDRLPRLRWHELQGRLRSQPDLVRGRLVLVGADYAASGDEAHRVPGLGPRTGIVVQALAIDTILRGYPLRPLAAATWAAALFVLAAGVVAAWLLIPSAALALRLTLGAVLMWIVVAATLVGAWGRLAPVAIPLLGLSLAAAAAALWRQRLSQIPLALSKQGRP